MRLPVLLLCLVSVVAVSCALPFRREIPAAKFRNYGDHTMNYTLYEGSSETHHYFRWNHNFASGTWKVRKSEMPFEKEFPVSAGRESIVAKDDQGRWQPMVGDR